MGVIVFNPSEDDMNNMNNPVVFNKKQWNALEPAYYDVMRHQRSILNHIDGDTQMFYQILPKLVQDCRNIAQRNGATLDVVATTITQPFRFIIKKSDMAFVITLHLTRGIQYNEAYTEDSNRDLVLNKSGGERGKPGYLKGQGFEIGDCNNIISNTPTQCLRTNEQGTFTALGVS